MAPLFYLLSVFRNPHARSHMRAEGAAGFFDATSWTTVFQAKAGREQEKASAMERLLTRYRVPILRQIEASLSPARRQEAEDLTQEFIYQCLRLDFLREVSPEHGLFRTFVKRCIANFLRDQHVRQTAAKRGSGQAVMSLDETDENGNRLLDPAGAIPSLEEHIDRIWAKTLLENSLMRLRKEYDAKGQQKLFAALEGSLSGTSEKFTAAAIGESLEMSEGAVRTALSRLRVRLGELLREEVRDTVGPKADWRCELSYLARLMTPGS